MLFNFYLNKNISFNKILVQKIFSKYIYTKFLILFIFKTSKYKSVLAVDNYFLEFSVLLKKKLKRLKYIYKLSLGKFLTCNIFLYKYSKLTSIFFLGVRFNIYIKKKIYFSLHTLKYILEQLNLVFIYKNIRGGFLGFSNNILGFFSKKYFKKLKNFIKKNLNLLLYKKYFILLNILSCLPYKYTNFSSFFFFNSGYIRTFQKIKKKKTLRRFFFKRFKFFFSVPFFILQKKISYLKKNFLKILKYKSSFLFYFIFKYFFSFLVTNKKKIFKNILSKNLNKKKFLKNILYNKKKNFLFKKIVTKKLKKKLKVNII
jgi:hypothetical protein